MQVELLRAPIAQGTGCRTGAAQLSLRAGDDAGGKRCGPVADGGIACVFIQGGWGGGDASVDAASSMRAACGTVKLILSLIHISEPTRRS
eukprot:2661863-Prymnesium_polylepis.1